MQNNSLSNKNEQGVNLSGPVRLSAVEVEVVRAVRAAFRGDGVVPLRQIPLVFFRSVTVIIRTRPTRPPRRGSTATTTISTR